MASTFTNIILHVVFSTKGRRPFLTDEPRNTLFRYIHGIIERKGGKLYIAGGTEDHVHLLVQWHHNAAVSDLARDVKSNSSRWIKREFASLHDFAWQRGYGAFSVSHSQVKKVARYIENQPKH